MLSTERLGTTDRRNDDVGTACHGGQIFRAGVSDGDGCITALALGHQQKGHRLANNETAADDNHFSSRGLYSGGDQKPLTPEWSAGDEGCGILHGELCHVYRMEAVDILSGIDGQGDLVLVDVLGRGGLDKNAVDLRVDIEFGDQIEQFVLRGSGGKFELVGMHAERSAGAVLVADIGLGGGVLSNKNYGESGGDAAGLEGLDARAGFEFDFGGDRLAINEFHGCE